MSFLDKLERTFGRFAIPGLSLYLVIGQAFVVLATMAGLLNPSYLELVPRQALAGQWWRLGTFLLQPPPVGTGLVSLVFLVFGWWIFYFMGSALEGYWGAFRYDLFLAVGYGLTVGLSFLIPDEPVSNAFLAGSVFLVFAYLNPDFEMALFLIIPVKIKWLGLLLWAFYLFQFIAGGWPARLQVFSAVGNIFLFCGRDLWRAAGLRTRQIKGEAVRTVRGPIAEPARHRCRICGKTDKTDPQLDFRYCSKCADESCYCPEHIFNHQHVVSTDEAARRG